MDMQQILGKVQELKKEGADKDEVIGEQMRQIASLEGKAVELEGKLDASNADLDGSRGKIVDLEARIADLDARVIELQEQNKTLAESASRSNELLEKLASELG